MFSSAPAPTADSPPTAAESSGASARPPSTATGALGGAGDVVEPRAVVPEDLALVRLGERQRQEQGRCPREVPVRWRIVGREDERVVAQAPARLIGSLPNGRR